MAKLCGNRCILSLLIDSHIYRRIKILNKKHQLSPELYSATLINAASADLLFFKYQPLLHQLVEFFPLHKFQNAHKIPIYIFEGSMCSSISTMFSVRPFDWVSPFIYEITFIFVLLFTKLKYNFLFKFHFKNKYSLLFFKLKMEDFEKVSDNSVDISHSENSDDEPELL